MFTNGPEDLGSISGRVIPKTLKMVLDASLLNTQQYKVRIKGKAIQGKEQHLPLHIAVVPIEKGAFWSPSTRVTNFTYFLYIYICIEELRQYILISRIFTLHRCGVSQAISARENIRK